MNYNNVMEYQKSGILTDPLVSVIIPVCNVEKYLNSCLISVIDQTYKNIEIILVDDGSTDSSGKKCNKWAEKDYRIKVIHKKNEGLNYARRDGFNKSTGKYVTFVDSDDVLHINAIELAVNNILDTQSDIAVFGLKEFSGKVSSISPQINHDIKVLTGEEQIFRYLLINDPGYVQSTLQLSVCGKLYDRNTINKIDWVKSNYTQHEDLFWSPFAFNGVKKNVCLNSSELYMYRRSANQKSLSRAMTGNSLNGKPVCYLELAHRFAVLMEYILKTKGLSKALRREFEDAVYNMYKGNLDDLIKNNLVDAENNILYLEECIEYSDLHKKNIIKTLGMQDRQIQNMGQRVEELESKLNPEHAQVKYLTDIIWSTLKYRIRNLIK